MKTDSVEKAAIVAMWVLGIIGALALVAGLIAMYVFIWPLALVATIALCVFGMAFISDVIL